MFSLLLLKLLGIAILLGAVFLGGYNTAHKFDVAANAKAADLAEAKYKAVIESYNQVSLDYETLKVTSAAQHTAVEKRVTQIVSRPIYRNVCLDSDGLLVANSALTRQPTSTTKPAATLPPSHAAQ